MKAVMDLRETFNEYAERYFKTLPEAAGLYDPFQYAFSAGGKRLRPVLCLEAAVQVGGDVDKALPAAMAVELFHNFSLMHDDIMDEADLRRGKPSVPSKYGRDVAILSGDVMLVKAYDNLLESVPVQSLSEAIHVFNKMGAAVCEGQMRDMDFERRLDVDVAEYIEMISGKTAALLGCSVELGALSGGAMIDVARTFYTIGHQAGIAFQIQDDILDAFGLQAKVGKKIGGDIIQNKKTILYVLLAEKASKADAEELYKWYSVEASNAEHIKVKHVMDLFEKYDIYEQAVSLRDHYWSKAKENMQELGITGTPLELTLLKGVQRDY